MKRFRITQDYSRPAGEQFGVVEVIEKPWGVEKVKEGFKTEDAARAAARDRMRFEAMHGQAAIVGPGIIRVRTKD